MIIDLGTSDPGSARADVAIIGGGIAGLIIAVRLANAGLRIVVIESGGLAPSLAPQRNEMVQLAKFHSAGQDGRESCLGGTSVRWSGKMIPFSPHDLSARPHLSLPAWPVRLEDLLVHLPKVERLFALDSGSFEGAPPSADDGVVLRYEKQPPYNRRNVRTLLDRELRSTRVQVFINATVCRFSVEHSTIASVTAAGPGNKTLTVVAKQFVVAAGAVESTRLLLNLARTKGGFAGQALLGRYFFDHLLAPLADVKPTNIAALNMFAGQRFVGGSLRGGRLELSAHAQAEDQVASAYGYIDFERQEQSGFGYAREVLRALQRRELPPPGFMMRAARDFPYLANAVFWKYRYRRLRWPSPAKYVLRVVAEQLPAHDNWIGLSDRSDRNGVPLAALHWQVRDADRLPFRSFSRRFAAYWEKNRLNSLAAIEWHRAASDDDALDQAVSDFCHPGGSTRMGRTPQSGVVNEELRTFAHPNLWVASTSVFPTGSSANPTLMLMLLSHRLVDAIERECRAPLAVTAIDRSAGEHKTVAFSAHVAP